MRGQKIKPELKTRIIGESLQAGCVIAELAKRHGISENTIYGWRSKYNEAVVSHHTSFVAGGSKTVDSASDAGFIELSVSEAREQAHLQEASLKFDNFHLSMQGKVKSSVLLSIIKILEEAC